MALALLHAAAATAAVTGQASLYSRLRGNAVYRATDLTRVDVTSGWDAAAGERAVCVFFRSFG